MSVPMRWTVLVVVIIFVFALMIRLTSTTVGEDAARACGNGNVASTTGGGFASDPGFKCR